MGRRRDAAGHPPDRHANALYLLETAEQVRADRALQMGLIQEMVPAGEALLGHAAARDGELRAGVRGSLKRRRAPREAGEGGATSVLHP